MLIDIKDINKVNALLAQQFAFEEEVYMLRRGLDNFIETAHSTKMDNDWDGICNMVSIIKKTEEEIEKARKNANAKRWQWIRLSQSK